MKVHPNPIQLHELELARKLEARDVYLHAQDTASVQACDEDIAELEGLILDLRKGMEEPVTP